MKVQPFDRFGTWMPVLLVSLFLVACASEQTTEEVSQPRWNFVFILLDDVGWNQVGYHDTSFYETPNIDRLAASGIHFTDAYSAAPICSPTRASIMTGKHPARLHLTDYIPGNPYPHNQVRIPDWTKHLPLEEVTIAEALGQEGYVSASFGKWHLNKDKNYQPGRPGDPASQGFDDVFTSVKPDSDADPYSDPHHVEEITEHSLRFLDDNQDRPFFLYVSHHVVHTPLIERPEKIKKYEAKADVDLATNHPVMGAMIERTDAGIGRILTRLDELELSDRTVVIFFSDNGGKESEQDQAPLRGGKSDLYEGGIRVPMAIRWPGVVQPGRISSTPVSSVDFFPTMLAIAGVEAMPGNIDGVDLTPLLRESGTLSREAIHFHYPHYHHFGGQPSSAIRKGDFKLIEWFDRSLVGADHPVSLFNLAEDLAEEHDLAAEMPDKTEELWQDLREWRQRTGAQIPTVNPAYDPEKVGTRR